MIELSVSLASNGVVKVPGYEQLVRFGYTKNRGVYRLAVTATGEWEGLTIRAFWHVPGGSDPASSLVVDGYVAVPASVTAQPGNGCITFEGSDGTKTVTSADLRYRVSANSGTEDGTTPEPDTPAWQELVDAVHTDATAAEQAKVDAQTAAQQSEASAKKAGQSAQEAAGSLQELKDGIANGNFKGEQGPKGETGPAVALDTTLTHEGEAADAKATGDAISAVKTRQNVLVGTETGNPLSVDDAFAAPLCGLTVYGRSTQDGTPTPDAPVPIVSAGDGGSVAVKVTGKNLFCEQGFQEYFINSVADTVGLAVGNVSSVLQVVTGAKYYVTRSKIGTKFRVAVVDELPIIGQPVRPSSTVNADSKRQVEISATSKYMIIQCEDEAGFSELMVSLDSSTTYSPYREQLLTLPTPNGLPGIPVTSGGNYTDSTGQQWVCDEVDLERGVKVQRVKSRRILSSEVNDTILGVNSCYIIEQNIVRPANNGQIGHIMCTHLERASWSSVVDKGVQGICVISNQPYIGITIQSFKSANEYKDFIDKNEVGLAYQLATPIETSLTPDEIAAYKALTAYGPDTVVQAGDGAGVKLEYQRDVNIAIKKLEDAIASMTTA